LCKKQAQRSQKSAATLSKTSPERLIFEKTGVEIQRQTCRGHLDMTACLAGEVSGNFDNTTFNESSDNCITSPAAFGSRLVVPLIANCLLSITIVIVFPVCAVNTLYTAQRTAAKYQMSA
jgi:hypothetical protein